MISLKSIEPRHAYRGVVAFALLLAMSLSSGSARAATAIAGDLDYAIPVNSSVDSGAGFGIRLGQQERLPPFVAVTPELAFTYHDFSSAGPEAYRGLLGVRLALGELLRPGVFAHLGVGHLTRGAPAASHTAFSYDVGAFLDFTLLPLLNLGAHAAYNRVNSGDAGSGLGWATLGIHAALIF